MNTLPIDLIKLIKNYSPFILTKVDIKNIILKEIKQFSFWKIDININKYVNIVYEINNILIKKNIYIIPSFIDFCEGLDFTIEHRFLIGDFCSDFLDKTDIKNIKNILKKYNMNEEYYDINEMKYNSMYFYADTIKHNKHYRFN